MKWEWWMKKAIVGAAIVGSLVAATPAGASGPDKNPGWFGNMSGHQEPGGFGNVCGTAR